MAELSDRDCLARAMYFESLRSSEEGMLAVGTTVMNRLDNPKFPKTVCGVVGQAHQYAPGALTSEVKGKSWARAQHVADKVLAGARHQQVGSALYFHTVGWHYPYHDAHYVAVAGGNAFYEKVKPQYQHFVPNLAPDQPGRFEAPPVRETQFARAEPPAPPREPRVEVAERDDSMEMAQADGSAPRENRFARSEPPRMPPRVRRQDVAELDASPEPPRFVDRPAPPRRPPYRAQPVDDENDAAPAARPPRRPPLAYTTSVERSAPSGRGPRSIDELLSSRDPWGHKAHVAVARANPMPIHPFTD